MKSRKIIKKELYIPLKQNGDKFEYMFDNRGKLKCYRSEETLLEYCPDCDKIAIYTLSDIKNKPVKKKN